MKASVLARCKSKMYFHVVQFAGKFVEQMVEGMGHLDESVCSSVVYILVQLGGRGGDMPFSLTTVKKICNNLSGNLAMARSHHLTINLMGTYMHLLDYSVLASLPPV